MFALVTQSSAGFLTQVFFVLKDDLFQLQKLGYQCQKLEVLNVNIYLRFRQYQENYWLVILSDPALFLSEDNAPFIFRY